MVRFLLALALLIAGPAFGNGSFQGINAPVRDASGKSIPIIESGLVQMATTSSPRATSLTVAWVKIGQVVTLHWGNNVSAACSSATSAFIFGGSPLPASIRPQNELNITAVAIQDNSTVQSTPGNVNITTTGNFNIYKTVASTAFTAANNCGFYGSSVTYLTN